MHNILVCDDDRDIVAALKIYLSGGEYRVFEAYNGAEAVEAVRKNDIHLVLMDIMMPELDGIAATAAIRRESNAPHHPAHGEEREQRQGARAERRRGRLHHQAL